MMAVMAAAAARTQALRATGVIVEMEPAVLGPLLAKMEAPLVITAEGGFFNPEYQYLVPYRGIVLFAKSSSRLEFPTSAEVIPAKSIRVPR